MRRHARHTCRILRSHWLKMPCNLTALEFHMQDVSPIDECGWTRTWGVNCALSINLAELSSDLCVQLAFTGQILLGFPHCSSCMKCSQVLHIQALSNTKTGKTSAPPQILSERRKKTENSVGRRRDQNRRTLNFPDSHPIFGKTSADCGDNVEFRPLFRKQNTPAPRKVSGQTEKFCWRSSSSRFKTNEHPLPPSP